MAESHQTKNAAIAPMIQWRGSD